MGFRNPATSAELVDTGTSPTGPGVRVYQDTAGPLGFPRGVVEFRDGVAGDGHATLTRTVNAVDTGGGVLTAVGGTFALDGGTLNGVPAGGLDLIVEEDPAGGFRTRARVRADLIQLPPNSGPGPALVTAGAGWVRSDGTYRGLVIERDPLNAWVDLSGGIQYVGGTGATQRLGLLAAPFLPAGGRNFIVNAMSGDVGRWVDVRPDGMWLRGAPLAGGAIVTINGSYPTDR